MDKSSKKIRFYIYILALIPLLPLLFTGAILLKYHTGAALESAVMGLDGHTWFSFHKLTALITVPLILLHLFLKSDWVKRFVTGKLKGKFKVSNIVLFIVFLLCALTALASGLISKTFGGIHNKLGIMLIIVFLIHLWNYRKLIINEFKKH